MAESLPTNDNTGMRLALLYGALFLVVGIHLPYWPVWLKAQGMGAAEIGILVAAKFWVKVVANPFVGHLVDKRGSHRTTLAVLSAISLLCFALFPFTVGFWSLLALSLISGGAFAAMIPLGENLTMLSAYAKGLDYGRLRLWGSISFIVSSVVVGWLLVSGSEDLILWTIIGASIMVVGTCLLLPKTEARVTSLRPLPIGPLLSSRTYWIFLTATGLISASHMVYYGFSSLHWRNAGISTEIIGWLWAEGVVAEIGIFAFSGAVMARFGPTRLLIIAGLGAALRWGLTGLTTDLPLLVAGQALHAISFGAGHLAAMHFLTKATPIGLSARAQTLYSSVVMGAIPGAAMLSAGLLYERYQGGAFLAGAVLALAGAALALILHRRWKGELLV